MSTKHTPGNWSFVETNYKSVFSSDQDREAIFTVVHNENSISETKANANLIAAAPDLLEALENIHNDNDFIPAPIWEMRNRAIAKAKGGKP